MFQHVPLQAQKPLLHSYPFREVMIVKDPSHSDMLVRLHWQLALEEKAPAQALFNTLVLYYSGNLRKSILFCSLLRVSRTERHLNYWTKKRKVSAEAVFFPFCCIKILVKGHVMLKTVILTRPTSFMSWYVLVLLTVCPFMKKRNMWCQKVNSAFMVLYQVVAWRRLQDLGNAVRCIAHAAMLAQKQLTHITAHTGKRQDQITKKNKGKNRREGEENESRGYCLPYLQQHSRC